VSESHGKRRPDPDYLHFHSRRDNRCSRCGTFIPTGTPVLGRPLEDGGWDIICLSCGSTLTSRAVRAGPRTAPAGAGVERPSWSTLVRYLRSCVVRESLSEPVPLHDRRRWGVLPLRSETVLCGNETALPLLDQLGALFSDLKDMEGVFYGWPIVMVEDERNRPFVAPLFMRELGGPMLGVAPDGGSLVPVSDPLPQVNMGLLTINWFSPELVAAAADVLASGPVGFGRADSVAAAATRLAGALGLPAERLDPSALTDPGSPDQPWRPQEVGVFNLVMAFKGELDVATRHLVRDLEWMERAPDWPQSAARFLFEPPPPPPAPALPASCAIQLNDSQETALAAAATQPLTVITGPPGTGKSQTVAAIVADARLHGERVLVTSANNTPVDGVIKGKTLPLDEGLVLRTGNADKRRELGADLPELVRRVTGRPPEPEAPSPAPPAATLMRHQAARRLEELASVQQAVLEAAWRRDRARAALWSGQPPALVNRARVEARARRASRTRLRWLKRRRTRACLALAAVEDGNVTAEQVRDWALAEADYQRAWERMASFRHANPGNLLAGFDSAERRWLAACRAATRNRVRQRFAAGAEALQELAEVLGGELPRRREAIERAMGYVSGWATSALSARPNFFCRPGAVDLVIVDEASQCTLAAVLPLAYRARRLVVVGDPRQLPPVVTAGGQELRALAAQAGTSHEALAAARLTYGEDSAYSAFAASYGREPHLLEEHYRCHPEIIQFCNQQFYDGRLTVLTRVDPDWGHPRGLEWIQVAGRTERGPAGGALNRAEAEAVAAWVAACGLDPPSLGVVTPFREQARLVRRLLCDQRHGGRFRAVRVGTAHTFQGGECETVLFSTVLSADANPGTVAWLESERNLVNMAVSRARKRLVVFGDREQLGRLGATTLVALAEAADRRGRRRDHVWSPTTVQLHAALVAHGIPAALGSVEEGYPLAITLIGVDGRRVDVEIDEFPEGDPRGRAQRQAATRDANLAELGWTVVRIPAWRAYLEPGRVAAQVLDAAMRR
jgi:hypothetical protein